MKYVGFWKRLLAYLLDVVPIGILTFAVFYFFLGFDQVLYSFLSSSSHSLAQRAAFLEQRNQVRDSALLLWILYCIFAEASPLQGTFGKKLIKVKVVNEEGERLSFMQSLQRNLFKILSAIPLFLGFMWIGFTKKKQGWHDLINKTYVIEREG